MIRSIPRALKWSMIPLGVVGTVVYGAGYLIGSRVVKGHPRTAHFNGRRFQNVLDEELAALAYGYGAMARRLTDPRPPTWEYRTCTPTVPQTRVDGRKVVTTFINHSTVLIQTEGLNILTDPIWAEKPSPLRVVGPGRFQNPGVELSKLPPIDVVLLSHNHYDHMDIATLRYLTKNHAPLILTHAGNSAYLARRGVQGAIDMCWGDKRAITDEVHIAAVPAQHNSERWLTDGNKTLWGGFVIETPRGNIYFAGDTGYGPFLRDINAAYPKGFMLGLLPIGAYGPRWYTRLVHTDPDEAFAIKKELKIKKALAIHFGTFQLGDEPQDEPQERLAALREQHNDPSFIDLPNGGVLTLR